MPIDNRQPSLVLNQQIVIAGVYPAPEGDGGSTIPMGVIRTLASNFVVGGNAMLANGALLNIEDHTALFTLLGTLYGGDGVTTFALPDLNARLSTGEGQGPGLSLYSVGQESGASERTLLQSNLPTSSGGIFAPVDNLQDTLTTTYAIRTEGIFPNSGGGSAVLNLIGEIIQFAGNFAPGGYLECNGQLVSILEYETLFNIIGTTYGGDGETTFAMPDLRGRTIIGANGQLGALYGSESEILPLSHLPVAMGGSALPTNNIQPSIEMTYLIALSGVFPSPDGDFDDANPMLGEIIAFSGNYAPSGYALANGQLLPINQHQALFSLLGTTYGGNGVTTFALPDLRGRSIAGMGADAQLGETFGSTIFDVLTSDIPSLNFAGTAGVDHLYGGGSDDAISGLGDIDTLDGNGGADVLRGGLGGDTLNGGDGSDWAAYESSASRVRVSLDTGISLDAEAQGDVFNSIENLVGSAFNDVLTGNGGVNSMLGGAGNDRMTGLGGDDFLNGGIGLDVLIGGAGADTLIGADGVDTADYSNSASRVRISLATGVSLDADAQGDIISGVENLIGTAFNDVLTGNDSANTLTGGDGADKLTGMGGSDVLLGGNGLDVLAGSLGADTLDGGDGVDAADYTASASRVRVNLATGAALDADAAGDNFISIETLIGSAFNDLLTGNDAANTLNGGAGNDQVSGLGGADMLIGGAGVDALNGGDGVDVADYSGAAARVRVNLATGAGLESDAQGDTLSNIENLAGSAFNDVLTGNGGVNTLTGGAGNDALAGGLGADALNGGDGADAADYSGSASRVRVNLSTGASLDADAAGDTFVSIENLIGTAFNDTLTGDAGANKLIGGAGNDQLSGLGGADVLVGDIGADVFIFNAALGGGNVDAISDFSVADDTIWIENAVFVGLPAGVLAANAFQIGAGASDPDDRIIYDATTGALSFDADGSGAGVAVQFASLATGLALTNADFLVT
jgi:microcystin-dependent protein